jgi:hypothetical protein
MTKLLLAAALAMAVAIFTVAWFGGTSPQAVPSSALITKNSKVAQDNSHLAKAVSRVPNYSQQKPALSELPPTLSPDLFTGNPKLAYQAAKEIPQTLAQLPCYCHCDMSTGHKSLHSCFVTEHGEGCGICINEALMAYGLEKRHGLNPAQIRERIIEAYGKDHSP